MTVSRPSSDSDVGEGASARQCEQGEGCTDIIASLLGGVGEG